MPKKAEKILEAETIEKEVEAEAKQFDKDVVCEACQPKVAVVVGPSAREMNAVYLVGVATGLAMAAIAEILSI